MALEKRELKRSLYDWAGIVCDLFFPRRCPVCDDLTEPGKLICGGCRAAVRRAEEPVCMRCGKPLFNQRKEYCMDCEKKAHNYKQGKSVFVYEGKIRQSMYRFKYKNRREYALFYAREAVSLHEAWIRRLGIEAIVPVPMYAGKKRQRGYNQAEVFAEQLGRELHLPVEKKFVERVRNTVPQKELGDLARKHNLKNAFQLCSDIVKYSKVLLVDDIYTTGSTMDAVAEVLLSAGVKEIYYICISIGTGY